MTMTAGRSVTMIPAKVNLVPLSTDEVKRRLRVAAYARVSTDDEEQIESYNAQVEYYTKKIRENDAWEFAGLYTDADMTYGQISKHSRTLCYWYSQVALSWLRIFLMKNI